MSGTIRWDVDVDSISEENSYSPTVEVGGMKWSILVSKGPDGEHLEVYLSLMNGECKVHSVDVDFEAKLINHADDKDTVARQYDITFAENECWGNKYIVNWDAAIDQEKGFVKNNKLTLQIDFELSCIIESRKRCRVDFTDQNEATQDVALVVDGEKFYVNKGYLSIISPVLRKMFYGDFEEKKKKEIELKDIDPEEFGELMKVIYPPNKKITDDNFDCLLKLGDRFEINTVMDQVERFLIGSSELTTAAKLELAGRYLLPELQVHCFDTLQTVKDVTNLKKTKEAKKFTEAINVALLDKIVKFTPNSESDISTLSSV